MDNAENILNKYKNPEGLRETIARVLQLNNAYCSWLPSVPNCFQFGSKRPVKTILIVGVTGAGKSTFIDALINFVLNVRYEDNHRFKVISLSDAEMKKRKNQAISQTDDITIYKIPYIEGGNIPYALNIIDTPGKDLKLRFLINFF